MLSEVIKNQLAEFDKLYAERLKDGELTSCSEFCADQKHDCAGEAEKLRKDACSFLTHSMRLAAEKAVGAVEEGVREEPLLRTEGSPVSLEHAKEQGCREGWNAARSSALQAGKKFLGG